MDQRLLNEIAHGKYLKEKGAGEIWGWETPAGKERWARRVQMLSAHINSKMRVLEVGCGEGYFTKMIVKTGAAITAIDISPDLIESARESIKAKNVTFKIDNAYDLSFEDESFDTVVGSSTLHHLEIDKALKEFYRILVPRGTIYFTEPNMLNPQIAMERTIPPLRRRAGNSANETAFFRWGLTKKLKKYGFVNIRVTPFDFLHPNIPASLIPVFRPICKALESTPIISEIAGSLYIRAEKY